MSSSTIVPPPAGLAAEVAALAAQVQRLGSIPPTTAATVAELGSLLVELEHLQDQLAGIGSRWLASFDAAGGPEEHGAPSLNVWARRELRVTPAETNRRTKRAAALEALPQTRAALAAGQIGLAHVDAISHGVHQLGAEVMAAVESVVLEVAATCDPNTVRDTIRKVRDTLDPNAGLAAYLRALERRDLTVTGVGEGFDVRGYLDPETGAQLKEVLYSLGKKTSVDDDRTAGQRRVDALGDLCRSVLDHGLPTDRGLRPHLFVTVATERLDTVTRQQPPVGDAAVLDGFGDISDPLLAKLACDCQITPIITGTDGHALDVGRTSRLATLKQRQAIRVQQDGVCFNPGCSGPEPSSQLHHRVVEGPAIRGLRHHLIHLGLLIVTPDRDGGWQHQTKHREYLPQHRRRATHLTRIYLQALTHGGKHHALQITQHYRRGRDHTVIRT